MIAWPLAAQNGCQSSYTWLFGSTCSLFQSRTDQFCSKWLPFPFNGSFNNQLFKMDANPCFLDLWVLKMAANLLILGLLAPHAPCSSPDLISSAQNGCHNLHLLTYSHSKARSCSYGHLLLADERARFKGRGMKCLISAN